MKRKLIKRNNIRINKLIQHANGWPLNLYMYDLYSSQMIEEDKYYAMMNKQVRTKKSRMSGEFEDWMGYAPSRYCVGRKGKINK